MAAGSNRSPEKTPGRTFALRATSPARTVFVFGAPQQGRNTREAVLDYTALHAPHRRNGADSGIVVPDT